MNLIESLETRTLLSAAPTVVALKAEARVILADLKAELKTGVANIKLIKADVKAAGELKASAADLKTLAIEGAAGAALTARAIIVSGKLIAADVLRVVADSTALAKHPTSAVLIAKLSAAFTTLTTDATNRQSVIANAFSAEDATNTTNLTALDTLDSTNTQLANDISNVIGPNSSAVRTALTGAISTFFSTDLVAFETAFPA